MSDSSSRYKCFPCGDYHVLDMRNPYPCFQSIEAKKLGWRAYGCPPLGWKLVDNKWINPNNKAL